MPSSPVPNPPQNPLDGHEQAVAEVARLAGETQIRRVHMLAWRDFDDPEAGGSELHAHEIAKLWGEAGLEVLMRTSYTVGRPRTTVRDGYEVVRKAGRYLVFPRAMLAEITRSHGPTRCDRGDLERHAVPLTAVDAQSEDRGDPPRPRRDVAHGAAADARPDRQQHRGALGAALLSRHARRDPVGVVSRGHHRTPGPTARRVQVVHNGISTRFVPGEEPTKPRPHVILAVGRLVPVKRFDMLVRAAAEARRTVPDLTLTIVGDGYERERIERLIERLGAQSWVHLARRITDEDLITHYQQARAVASASVREGWGLTLTEAAACGTPAVATRVVGHIDTVADGSSGILVDDEPSLARALIDVCTDDERWTSLVEGAMSHAQNFSWDRTAVEIFAALAGEARAWGNRGRTGRWR